MEEENKLNEEEEKVLNDLIITLAKKHSISIKFDEEGKLLIQEEDINKIKELVEDYLKHAY